MTGLEFIIEVARRISAVSPDGILPGHNGPYKDPETPIRNMGHWLITFAKCHDWTGDDAFLGAIRPLATKLLSKEARPFGFSFHHRVTQKKDQCNGLVGQAWTFEALVEMDRKLGGTEGVERAEEVFLMHPFDENRGLWNRLEIDGKVLSIDSTFNHQLWFAACSAMIKGRQQELIRQRISRFLDSIDRNLTVHANGLIHHPIEHLTLEERRERIPPVLRLRTELGAWRRGQWPWTRLPTEERRVRERDRLIKKSIGYHAFNTYAFALLKTQMPGHMFWKSRKLANTVAYLRSPDFISGLDENKFGYAYNPPGFEVPYSLCHLGKESEESLVAQAGFWINEQLRRCYSPLTGLFDRNSSDPLTVTARIYEMARWPGNLLESVEVDF